MSSNFNTYYENIDHDFWRKLCVEQGVLRSYDKGDYFIERGQVGRYIGFVKSGTLKYVAYGADDSESVVGLEFAGEFVADFPFSLYSKKISRFNRCRYIQRNILHFGKRGRLSYEIGR